METGANRDAKELMQKIGYEFKISVRNITCDKIVISIELA